MSRYDTSVITVEKGEAKKKNQERKEKKTCSTIAYARTCNIGQPMNDRLGMVVRIRYATGTHM